MSYPIQKRLYTATTVNVRSGPGHLGDSAPAILATLPPGCLCEIIGVKTVADGLTWHPVHIAVNGGDLFGWAAERVGDQPLLVDAPPVSVTAPVAPVIVAPPVIPHPNGSTPAPVSPPSTRTGNRLGFYLQSTDNGDGLWDAIATVQPPVMLLHADAVNDMLLNEVRSFRAPNTFIVGRWYLTNDEQRAMLESPDPEGQGRSLADRILNHDFQKFRKRTADGRLVIDAWMSLNECLPGPASGSYKEDPARYHALYAAYDRFQVAFRNHLMQEKIEAVAFNFAAGNFNDADVFLNHFPQTLATYVWLGFHEYGWPSMKPGEGASAAGIYRKVMAGIRAKYEARHRVIITEAGVTRAYGTSFDDKGWLNGDQPLSQDAYWDSLLWYNGHLNADDYVLGACLYQVGHKGDWATFRHLGRDNQGNPLRLVERISALRHVGARAAEPDQATARGEWGITVNFVEVRGRVLHAGAPVQGAMVRLLGGENQLGGVRGAVVDSPGAVEWTQKVAGYEGNLHNAWMKYVADDVAGISQAAFRRQMNAQYGDASHLSAGATYFFPQSASHPEIVWDRAIGGYAGDLRSAWLDWVQGKVVGLTYEGFKTLAPLYNPTLAKRDAKGEGALNAMQTYLLPRMPDADVYALEVLTNAQGDFDYGKVPAGIYEIEVVQDGCEPLRRPISLMGDTTIDLPINSMVDLLSEVEGRGEGSGAFMGVVGNEFVVNGQVFRFIGVNLRGLVYYGAGKPLEHATDGHRYETLAAARDMGAKVVRVFLPCVETTTQRTIELLSQTLDIAAAHGMYVLPALVDFYSTTPFRIPGDEHFYEKLDPNPDFHPMLLNHAFYRDGYRQRYLPFVQAVVSAFRDDTRIFAWEVGNELKFEPAAADPDRATFIAFMHSVARTIRQIDPNHLVATGMISTSHASLNEGDLWRRLYGTSDFDFLTVHCYNEEYGGKVDHEFARALNKPFIVEEAGFGKGRPGDRVDQTRRDMDYWFSRGARGYMQWGFMPIFGDNGDGDDDAGMDRKFHGNDYDGLFALYRDRANALASESAAAPRPAPGRPAPVPATPTPSAPPVAPPTFAVGQTVFAQTSLRVRQTPGSDGKPESDTLAILNPGDALVVVGGPVEMESKRWWQVRTVAGQVGFAAQYTGPTLLLALAAPSLEALQAMVREGMEVQG